MMLFNKSWLFGHFMTEVEGELDNLATSGIVKMVTTGAGLLRDQS
jgi:hypothetical protein